LQRHALVAQDLEYALRHVLVSRAIRREALSTLSAVPIGNPATYQIRLHELSASSYKLPWPRLIERKVPNQHHSTLTSSVQGRAASGSALIH
jgi:hypothetical protein